MLTQNQSALLSRNSTKVIAILSRNSTKLIVILSRNSTKPIANLNMPNRRTHLLGVATAATHTKALWYRRRLRPCMVI